MAAIPESASIFMSGLVERARKRKKTIVFPEGSDPRVLEAAARLARDGVVKGRHADLHRHLVEEHLDRLESPAEDEDGEEQPGDPSGKDA